MSKHIVIYLNLPSAVTPVPYTVGLPLPEPLNNVTLGEDNSGAVEVHLDRTGWENEVMVVEHMDKVVHPKTSCNNSNRHQ